MDKTFFAYVLLIIFFASCDREIPTRTLFSEIDSSKTLIQFQNSLVDSEEFNIMEYLYYYNGGGLAAGDINNDGLVDLYFTGNQVDDALYINQGNLKFKDISAESGINDYNGWSTGVSMVDINADGWLDIYVCRLGKYKMYNDKNRLYINNQDGTFSERAKEYGLDFQGFSTQATFFDYDRDGDLDCYLLNHSVKRPDQFVDADKIRYVVDELAGDRLYENDDQFFKNISKEAGILSSSVGFGLGVTVGDLNSDGWPDIYVGNDFHENDYLYINNQKGGFVNRIEDAIGHSSNFTMGTTIADINSDGRLDIFSLDMQPDDEIIFKQSGGWESKQIYDFKRGFGYHDQSPRNALQINLGSKDGIPRFSEQACAYGLHNTDWSWSPLVADFDLDGDQDIFITNGIHRRPNDMDFVNYFSDNSNKTLKNSELIEKMSNGRVSNVLFRFENGNYIRDEIGQPIISNGACIADLDNDGDWDIITNNIDEKATILVNNTNPEKYLKLSFRDTTENKNGIGVRVMTSSSAVPAKAYSGLISSSSGFQSMNEQKVIFPYQENLSHVKVYWPDGQNRIVPIDRDIEDVTVYKAGKKNESKLSLQSNKFVNKTLDVIHRDKVINDQNSDPLLPYARTSNSLCFTQNDQYLYMTQGRGTNGEIIIKSSNERIAIDRSPFKNIVDETCAIFFDADGDGDDDLFIGHGGMERDNNDPSLVDRIYINENGTFIHNAESIPLVAKNTSTVSVSDYDLDGDLDLFVGIRGVNGSYGVKEKPYILVNDGRGIFKALSLNVKGMIYDSEWSDVDGDGREDLIMAGHWMPVTVLYNTTEGFRKKEIANSSGLWFDIYLDDVDQDGDVDILAGNFGTNHRLEASAKHPMRLYVGDMDKNGQSDPIMSYYKSGKEYPFANLELLLKQLPGKKKKFQKVKEYANKQVEEIFSEEELSEVDVNVVERLNSSLFLNENNSWEVVSLPESLQLAPIFAITSWSGGYIFGGNLHDVDPNWGRQDAFPLTFAKFNDNSWSIIKEELPIFLDEVRSVMSVDEDLWMGVYNDSIKVIERDKLN